MSMRQTIAVISQMEAGGIIGRYVIGGAVASFLYIDVTFTEDLDILVSLDKGFTEFRKEGIVVHGWPAQFLPGADPPDEEGLQEAVVTELPVDRDTNVRCRVLRAEHLMAKALAVGRPKDHVRLTQFIEAGRYDAQYFCEVLDRHGLSGKWRTFCEKFDVIDPCSGLKP
jgi:hypothetical protein